MFGQATGASPAPLQTVAVEDLSEHLRQARGVLRVEHRVVVAGHLGDVELARDVAAPVVVVGLDRPHPLGLEHRGVDVDRAHLVPVGGGAEVVEQVDEAEVLDVADAEVALVGLDLLDAPLALAG